MKGATIKKLLTGLGGSSLILALSLLPAVSASAQTYPYFKAFGADVSAGGWFDDASGSGGCVTSNFQDGSSANPLNGGILTYDNGSGGTATGGASSQYGAFALGNIDTTSGTPNGGFYSDGAQAGSVPVNQLSFANINSLSNSSGGQFDNSSSSTNQCIPDYFDAYSPAQHASTINTTTNPVAYHTSNGGQSNGEFEFFNASGNGCAPDGVYYVDATSLPGQSFNLDQGAAQTVCDGSNIAIVVKGNVVIDNNIQYPPADTGSSTYNANDLPKLVVVAQGNIYVAPNVRDLDGWYIAQPDTSTASNIASSGYIWDCFPADSVGPSVLGNWVEQNCNSPLVVQGALTAKEVELLRTNGNVSSASTNEDRLYPNLMSSCDTSSASGCNVSEIFNYSPNMVVGCGFFDQCSSTPKIEQLLSLPPVF